ncbi:MAG TPA: methionyl-tRNA formyltransferase [Candidatus Paceibacterota bacterium]|nr:methionyl-tRNA formyltransferase [Candidatus Paceibacterota bacterium]
MKKEKIKFAFFGTTPLSEGVLSGLAAAGLTPQRVIDSASMADNVLDELSQDEWDVFVVASFGAILPKRLLDIPKRGVLNVHPSLLPRLRGPSPIRSAILNDEKETGVSIMLLDEEMDHGPLLAQKKIPISAWPPHGKELDALLAHEGGKLLAQILPLWVAGKIKTQKQNHDLATYTEKFTKEDGLLDLNADPYKNLLKIRAFEGWPGTYAFFDRAGNKLRVQILDAHLEGSKLVIDLVKPEGKKEMPYVDFLNSGARPL